MARSLWVMALLFTLAPTMFATLSGCRISGELQEESSEDEEAVEGDLSTRNGGEEDPVVAPDDAATPIIKLILPTSGPLAGGTSLTIVGEQFRSSEVTVKLGEIDCGSVNREEPTLLTCVTGAATQAGAVDVTVTNPNGKFATLTGGFDYLAGDGGADRNIASVTQPSVASVSPTNGKLAGGGTLVVTGTNFPAAANVTIGSSACAVTQASATEIQCALPAMAAGAYDVVVTDGQSLSGSLAAAYTYNALPTISGVIPASGSTLGGTSLTISGSGFQSGLTVSVGGVPCASPIVSGGQIVCSAGAASAGASDIVVTNPDTQSVVSASAFTVLQAPALATLSPTNGRLSGGITLTVTGSGFLASPTVIVGGTDCPVTASTSTAIECTMPVKTAGEHAVSVSNTNGIASPTTLSFTYNALPTITSIAPSSGPTSGGTALTVTGTGFLAGVSATVGGAACGSVSRNNDGTQVTCVTPSGAAGAANIVLTNADTQSVTSAGGFTFIAPPTLSSVSLTNGKLAGGDTLTLTGTDFTATTTLGSAKVGTTDCPITQASATSLRCTLPAKTAGTYDVTVTNADGQTSTLSSAYRYNALPTITSIGAATGPASGGSALTFTGTGFISGLTVTVGGATCTVPGVSGCTNGLCTSASCNIPSGTAGAAAIVLTNPDTQSVTYTGFSYDAAPTLSSVAPTNGKLAGGGTLTLTGADFQAGTPVVKIGGSGGTDCTSPTRVSDTSITCTLPAKDAGGYAVYVRNPDGQSTTLNAAYTYNPIPTVTGVAPAYGLTTGGTAISLTGTGFLANAAVSVGGTACANVSVASSTSITCDTPSGSAGTVSVAVANADTQSGTASNSFIYYTPATALAVTGPSSTVADSCSTAFTVTLKDSAAATTTAVSSVSVSLSGGGAGTFYSDSGCANSITSLSIGAGSSSGQFYFKDATLESLTLTAAATDLTSGTISHQLTWPTPYLSASSGNRIFPTNPLSQNTNLTVDFDNIQSGSATDTGMIYACGFDITVDGSLSGSDACTTLPGTVTFDTATGALSWTPNEAAWGAYEIVVTGTNSTGSGTKAITVDVRELYSSTNLIADYDAQFFNRVNAPASVPQTQWKDLTNNGYHATVPANLSSNWVGNGGSNPWHLSFDGSDVVSLPLGDANTNLTAMSFGMWIRADAPTALGKVILGNGGGSGNGFVLRQSDSAMAPGKIEIEVGNGSGGSTVQDLAPIHYWRLGDSAGPTVTDDFGGYSGTATNGPTFGGTGSFPDGNKAMTFDGVDDHVVLSNMTDFPSGTTARTMCGWGKPVDVNAGYRWVFAYGNSSNSQAMFIGMNGSTLYGGGYANDITVANFWQAGAWKHVCLTYDGTTAKLYGNGAFLTSGAKSWNLTKSYAAIGKQVNGGEYWKGDIDEVALFNRALSDAEVTDLYNATAVWKYCSSKKALVQGNWTHLGGTYDGSILKLFVNGSENCSLAVGTGFTSPATALTMGGKADGTSTWAGDLMHLAFYNASASSNVTGHRLATWARALNEKFCVGSKLANAPFATASTGSSGDPHLICTVAQLYAIDDDAGYLDDSFQLVRNLDLSVEEGPGVPIASSGAPFNGNLDGQFHTISNLSLGASASDYQGFFAVIGATGVVKRLTLADATVSGRTSVGGFAGASSGVIQKVSLSGTSSISSSYSSTAYVGGIVGYLNKPGLIEESFAGSGVSVLAPSGGYRLGGIAGMADGTGTGAGLFSTIQNSYSRATVTTSGGELAGIVGYAKYSKILNNYFSGVANDSVNADSERGGVGYDWGGNTFANNFFDSTVCAAGAGCASSAITEVQGLSTALMKSVGTYLRTGWDFETIWTTPGQAFTGQYPMLLWEPAASALPSSFGGGDGLSANTAYQISSAEHLQALISQTSKWQSGAHFQLMADLDLNGLEISPIGSSAKPFNGNFNGGGFTISDFTIKGTADDSNVGFFGSIAAVGVVRNLILSDITVTGKENVGGIAGYSEGTIQKSAVKGTSVIDAISNGTAVGGIVGNLYKGLVEESFAGLGVTVRSTTNSSYHGGIVGYSNGISGTEGTIRNCYSHATVTGNGYYFGGIVGYARYSKVLNNYSAGVVNDTTGTDNERGVIGYDYGYNTFTNNFYDATVCTAGSGCAIASYNEAQGVTTVQAKSVGTYLRTGWDFKTIWTTPVQAFSGQYPVLLWESGQSAIPLAFGGGDGLSADTAYQITTAAHLQALLVDTSKWDNGSHFRLTTAIDLGGIELSPIGSSTKPFNGNFNGGGIALSNFTVKGTVDDSNVGFFGSIAAVGVVRNLILSDITVTGKDNVGGIAGYSEGTIQKSAVKGTSVIDGISNGLAVGGLVGKLYKGLVEESFAGLGVTVRSTTNSSYHGGIVGYSYGISGTEGTVRNCYSHASVTGNGYYFGGIVGYAGYSKVLNNYSAGVVNDTTGTDNERGVIGTDWSYNTFSNNFYDAEVCTAGGGCATGVYNEAQGVTTAQAKSVGTYLRTGWDFKTIWTTPVQAFSGQYPVLLWESGQSAIPLAFGSGDGLSADTAFQITTAAHLQALLIDTSKWNAGLFFRLTTSLDLGGLELAPIGSSTTPFSGTFDGGGFMVSNLSIKGTTDDSNVGFFGYLSAGAVVKDLALSGISVSGSSSVGGFAGYSAGTIQRCALKGTSTVEHLSNASRAGGIVGFLYKPGLVEECYAESGITVKGLSGATKLGGIVGDADGTATSAGNFGTIQNCYSHATVTGNGYYFGGILGYARYVQVLKNYSAGIANDTVNADSERGVVGYDQGGTVFTDNYFDSDVCAAASGYCAGGAGYAGITALATGTLQNKTNVSASWDFADVWAEPGAPFYFTLRRAP